MAKVVRFYEYGGPNVLRVDTETPHHPGADEVRVRMSVIALNRANTLFREGTYLSGATFPSRICSEGVGTIDAVGANITDWEVGQRVNLLPPENESKGGYAAEFVVVRQNRLLPAPERLSDRLAATAWVPFLTLYHLFVEQEQAAIPCLLLGRMAAPGMAFVVQRRYTAKAPCDVLEWSSVMGISPRLGIKRSFLLPRNPGVSALPYSQNIGPLG
ncbi:MAG: alcohol dehydrogenase catalytic domain-containing protein [Pseudomonadota bacterium]